MEREYKLVDTKTGEIYDAVIYPKPKRVGGKWTRLFQDAFSWLAVSKPEITGETYRVFTYLIGQAGYQNILPRPVDVAKALGMKSPSVFRAYRQLLVVGFLVKRDHSYFLTPVLCWKGSPTQLENAYHKLFNSRSVNNATDR